MNQNETSRVIVGVSESLAGLQALRYAVAEVRRRGAVLHAVRAWQFASPWRGYDAYMGREDLAATAEATVRSAFDLAMGGVPDDVAVSMVIAEAPTGPALVSYANRDDDLLVVGRSDTHWLPVLAVDRCCTRAAGCVVVVVPPPAMAGRRRSRSLERELRREADAVAIG